MKTDRSPIKWTIILSLIIFALASALYSQSDLRSFPIESNYPFDFSDKFYFAQGVDPDLLIERRNGADGMSVFDVNYDRNSRNIRLIATYPAYDREGNMLFWNHYADVAQTGFVDGKLGEHAEALANTYPVYMFPSKTFAGSNRQAALIDTDTAYFMKNPLGIGVVILVEYTEFATSPKGEELLSTLMKGKAYSLDRTPMITSTKEIGFLDRAGLVKQSIRGTWLPTSHPYIIARAMDPTLKNAIAPDAYLVETVNRKGSPLEGEKGFAKLFACIQETGGDCILK